MLHQPGERQPHRFKISQRLRFMTAISVLCVIAVSTYFIFEIDHHLHEEKQTKTRHLVETVHSMLEYFHDQELSGRLTREEAQAAAIKLVKRLRYESQEYFWINDLQPKMIMHPYKPELDDKDLSSIQDPAGKHLFTAFVDKLHGLVNKLMQTSESLQTSTMQVTDIAHETYESVERQRTGSDQVASAMTELQTTAEDVSANAVQAATAAELQSNLVGEINQNVLQISNIANDNAQGASMMTSWSPRTVVHSASGTRVPGWPITGISIPCSASTRPTRSCIAQSMNASPWRDRETLRPPAENCRASMSNPNGSLSC